MRRLQPRFSCVAPRCRRGDCKKESRRRRRSWPVAALRSGAGGRTALSTSGLPVRPHRFVVSNAARWTLSSGEHTLTATARRPQFFFAGCQRCGGSSPIRLFGCASRRVNTSLRYPIVAVQFCRSCQAHDGSRAFTGPQRIREQPVVAAHGDGSNLSFDRVVVDGQPPISQVTGQCPASA